MYMKELKEVYFDDNLYKIDNEAGAKLFRYIQKIIGIEQYINKILKSPYPELHKRCFTFLSMVDCDNKEDWKRYFKNIDI